MNVEDENPIVVAEVERIVETLLTIASCNKAPEFRALFLGGIVANVAGNLPDDYWVEFMKVEKCNIPGCDCDSVIKETVLKAINALRDDHNKTMKRKNKCN